MIHRIDRVNPDVDDRVIKPNEARMAVNFRFGASTEDTNLSGGTLILGNKQIPFTLFEGVNKVVGVYSDFESGDIYFALYNQPSSGGFGLPGLYRINSKTDQIEPIVRWPFLNFKNDDDYNVSMTVINGLLYWTDNYNEPRVINIEKGIRTEKVREGLLTSNDIYEKSFRPTNFSQIKRPPGTPPFIYTLYKAIGSNWYAINTSYNCKEASTDFELNPTIYDKTGFGNDNGYQFSYYYIYDNNEESRLAPWSEPIFWKTDIVVQVPAHEMVTYVESLTIIKKIVFVYRINNDGIPYVMGYKDNISSNYILPNNIPKYNPIVPDPAYGPTPPGLTDKYIIKGNKYVEMVMPSIQFVCENLSNLSKTPVAADIVDQRFDSVPLLSETNVIAQNRLNHANYILDRDTYTGLSLQIDIENVPYSGSGAQYIAFQQNGQTENFKPGGIYEVGIELLDENGRPIGVINNVEVEIPKPKIAATYIPQNQFIPFGQWYDDVVFNTYKLKYTITGNLPSWASYCRVVSTGVKNINYFHKGIGQIFYWYQTDSGDIQLVYAVYYNPANAPLNTVINNVAGDKKVYKYRGIAVDKMNMPVNYSPENNLYIKIGREFTREVPTGTPVEMEDFKIVGQYNNLLFVEMPQFYFVPAGFGGNNAKDLNQWTPYWYTIEVYSKKNIAETVFYQSTEILRNPGAFSQPVFFQGYVPGDCYNAAYKKSQATTIYELSAYSAGNAFLSAGFYSGKRSVTPLIDAPGVFTSMNPTNCNSSNWVWQKGQPAIINQNQKETRISNGIIFSDPILQNTQINGLNKFNSLNYRLAPIENGPIRAMVTTNATQREPGVLLAIGMTGVSSFYYDAIQLTNVDGSDNVTTTDAYLASQRPLVGQYGCSRPMSVTKTPLGTVYWYSDVVNDLIRYSNAGLERLGLTFSFANYIRNKLYSNQLINTWYDQVTDEINCIGKGTFTFAFSERYKTFQGERDFTSAGLTPERVIGNATKQYFFLNGEIWVSNVNDGSIPYNFIFNTFKDPEVTLVTNESPSTVKRWNQVKIYGGKPKSTILYTAVGNEQIDLVTKIEPGYYINRKGDWEAAIRRALDSNGEVMAGKLMESRIIYSKFAFDADGFEKLNFIEVKSNVSIVQ